MLVYVRPSNEALLRARVPGAQDQRGCHSIPFIVRVPRAGGRLGYPSRPESAKTASSPWDAPPLSQARPQRTAKDDPSKLARILCPWDGPDESPTARNFPIFSVLKG